jgi:hypothetical protein
MRPDPEMASDNGIALPIFQTGFARDDGRTLGNVLAAALVIAFSAPETVLALFSDNKSPKW